MKKKISLEIDKLKGKVTFSFSYTRQKKIDNLIKSKEFIKLHMGCGNVRLEGYINIDIVKTQATDLVADIINLSMFPDNCAEEILLNAVFEHLYKAQHKRALTEWHRILKPKGRLIINWIPDFKVIIDAYIKRKPGIEGTVFDLAHVSQYFYGETDISCSPPNLHKDIFTKDSVRRLLEDMGYEIIKIENRCFEDEQIPVNICVVAVKPVK